MNDPMIIIKQEQVLYHTEKERNRCGGRERELLYGGGGDKSES